MKTMKKLVALFILGLLFLPFGIKVVNAGEETNTFTVNVTYTFDEFNADINANLLNQPYGGTFQLTPSTHPGYTWAYWIVNGVVRYELPQSSTFTVSSNLVLQGVYAPEGSHSVVFLDSNGTVIDSQYVLHNGLAVAPDLTGHQGKPGLIVHATTPWRTPMGVAYNPSAPVTVNMVYVLQYQASIVDTCMMTVNGQAEGPYDYNELVTVVADAMDVNEDSFSHWEEDGIALSRDLSYSFTAVKNRTLTAVYVASPSSDVPLIHLTRDIEQRQAHHTYVGQFYLPETGYDLVEYGFLIDQDNTLTLTKENADYIVPSNTYLEASNEFVTSFAIGTHMNVRAYLTVKSGTTVSTIYSDLNPKYIESYNNFENFENMTTWSSYPTIDTAKEIAGISWTIKEVLLNPDASDKDTADPIVQGLKMLRFRGANTAYMYTDQYLGYVSSITFDAKYYNASNNTSVMKVWKQVEGFDWVEVSTVSLSLNYTAYSYDINEHNVRIKITVNTKSSNLDNIKIFGIYTGEVNKVTYNNNSTLSDVIVRSGIPTTEPTEPTREGYAFGGWYLEPTYVTEYNFSNNVSSDFTLYAKWIELSTQYTVSYNSDGGSAVSSELVYEDLYASEPIDPTKVGYRFNYWAVNVDPFAEFIFASTAITADIELIAIWVEQVTVTFNSGGGSAIDSQTIDINTNAVEPADPTYEGYRFDYWAVNVDPFTDEFVFASTAVTADIELIAIWVEQVTVTFDSDGGNSVSPQTLDINGLANEPTAPAKAGFSFVEWVDFASNPFDFTTDTITADITLYATWLEEVGQTYATDLFISEYIEWNSGNNKAIEIYNGTGATVNLSAYSISVNANANTTWSTHFTLSGTLNHGDVVVITHSSADSFLLTLADLTWGSLSPNGDDAIGLFKNSVLIDIFGVFGVDPGTGWTVNDISNATADHTIVRNPNVISPVTTWNTSEWTVYDQTVAYLGAHTFSPE